MPELATCHNGVITRVFVWKEVVPTSLLFAISQYTDFSIKAKKYKIKKQQQQRVYRGWKTEEEQQQGIL